MTRDEHRKAYEEHTLAADAALRGVLTGVVLLVADHKSITADQLRTFAKASRQYTDELTAASAHLALSMLKGENEP